MSNKYNGWSNYETWNFKLWLDNDEDLHNYIIGEIKKIKEIGTSHIHEVSEVSNFLRSYIDDNVPNLNLSDKNGFYQDILSGGLREINTHEVAESYLEDLKEDEPETTLEKMDTFDRIDHLERRALLDAQMNGEE